MLKYFYWTLFINIWMEFSAHFISSFRIRSRYFFIVCYRVMMINELIFSMKLLLPKPSFIYSISSFFLKFFSLRREMIQFVHWKQSSWLSGETKILSELQSGRKHIFNDFESISYFFSMIKKWRQVYNTINKNKIWFFLNIPLLARWKISQCLKWLNRFQVTIWSSIL